MEYLPLLVYWGLQFAVALALVVGAAVVAARITAGRLLVWAGVLAAAAATIPQVAIAFVLDRTLPTFRPDVMVGVATVRVWLPVLSAALLLGAVDRVARVRRVAVLSEPSGSAPKLEP
jgi:hypothetical protein